MFIKQNKSLFIFNLFISLSFVSIKTISPANSGSWSLCSSRISGWISLIFSAMWTVSCSMKAGSGCRSSFSLLKVGGYVYKSKLFAVFFYHFFKLFNFMSFYFQGTVWQMLPKRECKLDCVNSNFNSLGK